MQKTINSVLRNPAARALILVALIIPVSAYLGTNSVRRGFLYHTATFGPSVVAAIAVDVELEVVLDHARRLRRAYHACSDVPVPGPVIRFAMTPIAAGIKGSRH